MSIRLPGRRITVGCALAADGLYVAVPAGRSRAPLQFSLVWNETSPTPWPERFQLAMNELVTRCGTSHLALRMAILPPLLRHRFVSLPAIAAEDARRVLRRDAGRYFCGVKTEQEVAVTRKRRGAALGAAAADIALLDAMERAVTNAGAELVAVFSAYDVWARIACDSMAGPQASAVSAAVIGATRYDRLTIERRQLLALRYGPARHFDGKADIAIPDDESWRQRTAAAAATDRSAVPLVLERLREARAQLLWREARWWGVAAVLLLALAGALDLWGLGRERDALRIVRQAEREATSGAVTLRETATLRARHLEALTLARHSAPRWTPLLAQLAETLPADAYLTGLQAAADSIIIEGVAGSAAGVFNALHEMRGIAQVRALAPIRHERVDGEAAIERFVIGLQLASTAVEAKP